MNVLDHFRPLSDNFGNAAQRFQDWFMLVNFTHSRGSTFHIAHELFNWYIEK